MFLFPEFTDMVENPGVPDVGLIVNGETVAKQQDFVGIMIFCG